MRVYECCNAFHRLLLFRLKNCVYNLLHSFAGSGRAVLLPGRAPHRADTGSLSNVREVVHVNCVQTELRDFGTRDTPGFTINNVNDTRRSCTTGKSQTDGGLVGHITEMSENCLLFTTAQGTYDRPSSHRDGQCNIPNHCPVRPFPGCSYLQKSSSWPST